MKHLYNIMVVAGMVVLLPFMYVSYKIADLFSEEPPEEPEIRHTKKTTAYPDGMYPDPKDFNKWQQYISREFEKTDLC